MVQTNLVKYIEFLIHTDELTIEDIKLGLEMQDKLSPNASLNIKNKTIDSSAKIPYKDYHKQKRNNAWDSITIVSHDSKILVKNYKIQSNRSFIMTKGGGIKPQKYGGNIWEDESGVNHYAFNK